MQSMTFEMYIAFPYDTIQMHDMLPILLLQGSRSPTLPRYRLSQKASRHVAYFTCPLISLHNVNLMNFVAFVIIVKLHHPGR